ncbi:MAG: U32 family peptidase [Lachnospiraceae bacterium]|nr:U32 family peptidase [Lachnospiraceae bacterium]
MKPEILAPAGSMEAMKAAVHAGANAVYLGGNRFGARAYANNFDETALVEAIEYCHLYGVKVYLTINTLFRNEEISELFDYLCPLYVAGLDAVIVQDFGVMRCIHLWFPDLPIHASTQMTITTPYAYKLLKNYGVTRIVPARELSMDEIKDLKRGSDVPEIEVFVQGALCYCYSGQCLMSSVLGGRSGNRGRCAQTCRLPYALLDEQGNSISTKGDYLLSPKDLCGLDAIPDLIAAGVDSFKIEGRMKRPEYVAVCVRAYRKMVDAWYEGTFSDALVQHYKKEMAQVFNRGGFTKGYYYQKNGKDMMSIKHPGDIGVCIGKIVSIQKNRISIALKESVSKGDILIPDGEKDNVTLTSNVDGNEGAVVVLNAPKTGKLHKGQMVYRTWRATLMQELSEYVTTQKMIPIKGRLFLHTGEQAKLSLKVSLNEMCYEICCCGETVLPASNKPLTIETVEDKIGKLGNTRYYFDELEFDISEDAFYPLKALKDLRRRALLELEQRILSSCRRALVEKQPVPEIDTTQSESYAEKTVMVSTAEQYDVVKQFGCFDKIYLDVQYFSDAWLWDAIESDKNRALGIVLPPILRKSYLKQIEDMITKLQEKEIQVAMVVRNVDELSMLRQFGYLGRVIADYSLYTMNDQSREFIRDLFENAVITLPVELNEQQLKKLKRVCDNSEMEVYGYQQLMVSGQCLQNTTNVCNRKGSRFVMQDRYLKNFFIFSICKYCYNLIYNGIPTVLYDLTDRDWLQDVSKRFHFTKESREEVCSILDAFQKGEMIDCERTRGHYKRGVE